ncbi:MAG: hypothetical protein U5J99_04125 [Parvularculaceae bacterium]|nr:hypothetical protein [Parvularculaceae bacterium]
MLLCATAALGACNTITIPNAGGDAGVLIDGAEGGLAFNDRGRVGSNNGVVLLNAGESVALGPNRNEAIAFGALRAPARTPTPWTDNDDGFETPLASRLNLPVTVWIVQGPFGAQRDRAIDACVETSAIWDAERIGVRFSEFLIRDATNDPDITPAILDSVGGDSRNWDDFSTLIGFDAGRINIYWINTVEGMTGWGWSDFGGRIVMARDTLPDLLSHEIGHAFSLRHSVNCGAASADFDATNVMAQCSNSRQFLTEAQVFRSHFNMTSSVNALYSARPGAPTVSCIGSGLTEECPALNRRLWDDGAFPSN